MVVVHGRILPPNESPELQAECGSARPEQNGRATPTLPRDSRRPERQFQPTTTHDYEPFVPAVHRSPPITTLERDSHRVRIGTGSRGLSPDRTLRSVPAEA